MQRKLLSIEVYVQYIPRCMDKGGETKEDLCIEAQEIGKIFSLIIKSIPNNNNNILFEGIFIDAKGVNCGSLEIVRAKKCFL